MWLGLEGDGRIGSGFGVEVERFSTMHSLLGLVEVSDFILVHVQEIQTGVLLVLGFRLTFLEEGSNAPELQFVHKGLL